MRNIRLEFMKSDRNDNSQSFVIQEMVINTSEWKKYENHSHVNIDRIRNAISVSFFKTEGDVDLCHLSLFPVDAFKGRKKKNGHKKDLAEALYDLKPGVFRFPGGCVVEGLNEKTRYQLKNTNWRRRKSAAERELVGI